MFQVSDFSAFFPWKFFKLQTRKFKTSRSYIYESVAFYDLNNSN